VIGYCLMPNHVHLIVAPHGEDSLSKALGRTHLLYTQHVNRLQGRSGHLWQNRFYSCPLDERHCWAALRYAERNPVRAGMVRQAWRYPWSSAMAHVGAAPSRLLTLAPWRSGWDAERWKQWLRAPDDEDQLAAIRVSTHTGRPLGSDRFLSKLENLLGRRLRSLAVGRPRQAPGAE
jgi:putative transposase